MEEKNVCASESVVEGSHDVWSSEPSLASSADHLVVTVNGILGRTTDWKYDAEQFVKELPDKVFVHLIRSKPNMRKISFVAHYVGGLVERYAIGRLYRPPEKGSMED